MTHPRQPSLSYGLPPTPFDNALAILDCREHAFNGMDRVAVLAQQASTFSQC